MGFYYQTAILEQAGGEPPATWDEWKVLADKVRTRDSSRSSAEDDDRPQRRRRRTRASSPPRSYRPTWVNDHDP